MHEGEKQDSIAFPSKEAVLFMRKKNHLYYVRKGNSSIGLSTIFLYKKKFSKGTFDKFKKKQIGLINIENTEIVEMRFLDEGLMLKTMDIESKRNYSGVYPYF